jgi:aldehyde dehydrogenase family protein
VVGVNTHLSPAGEALVEGAATPSYRNYVDGGCQSAEAEPTYTTRCPVPLATRANAIRYGLSAAIHTTTRAASNEFVRTMQTGVLEINAQTTGLDLHVPFAGRKDSGWGPAEQSVGAADFYTDTSRSTKAHDLRRRGRPDEICAITGARVTCLLGAVTVQRAEADHADVAWSLATA